MIMYKPLLHAWLIFYKGNIRNPECHKSLYALKWNICQVLAHGRWPNDVVTGVKVHKPGVLSTFHITQRPASPPPYTRAQQHFIETKHVFDFYFIIMYPQHIPASSYFCNDNLSVEFRNSFFCPCIPLLDRTIFSKFEIKILPHIFLFLCR